MPHSPRWFDGKLWVLNSGTGHLGTVDVTSAAFTAYAFCPGFLRGLAFHNGHAVVGLSLPRDGSFSGLALEAELKRRDAEPWCGVQVINLGSGDIVEWIRLEGGVTELFDVAVIPASADRRLRAFLMRKSISSSPSTLRNVEKRPVGGTARVR